MPRQVEDYVEEPAVAPPWIATDTIIISALLIVAAMHALLPLGHPAEIVFDEVHFVAQGRHYLHGESFLDPHPPLAKLIIAAGIAIFGDHPWGWRVGNATLGTAIVGITYLLGRRMSGSRLDGCAGGRDHPARRDVPGRFALRRHRHRLSHVRGRFVFAVFQIRADARRGCAPANSAVAWPGAGFDAGQQALHPGDHVFAGDGIYSLCAAEGAPGRPPLPTPAFAEPKETKAAHRSQAEESQVTGADAGHQRESIFSTRPRRSRLR